MMVSSTWISEPFMMCFTILPCGWWLVESEVSKEIFDYSDESFHTSWGGGYRDESSDPAADTEFLSSLPSRS